MVATQLHKDLGKQTHKQIKTNNNLLKNKLRCLGSGFLK